MAHVGDDLASELHHFLLSLLTPVGKVPRRLLHLPHQAYLWHKQVCVSVGRNVRTCVSGQDSLTLQVVFSLFCD